MDIEILENWFRSKNSLLSNDETNPYLSENLTDWEKEFLKSVIAQWEEKRRLSTKQWAIVKRIKDKLDGNAGLDKVSTKETSSIEHISDPIFPINFSNRNERKGWYSDYTNIGSIPSFLNFLYKEKDSKLENLLSQTYFLENANRERLKDESRDLISNLSCKIFQRGTIPFSTYGVENKIIKNLELNSFLKENLNEFDQSNYLQDINFKSRELITPIIDKKEFIFDEEFDNKDFFDSELEREFFLEWIKQNFGESAQKWIFPQVNIDSILRSYGLNGDGNRRSDFLFSHPDKTFFIELDGEEHNQEKAALDKERDDALASCGFQVFRIPNTELINNDGDALNALKEVLNKIFQNKEDCSKKSKLLAKAALDSSTASKLQYAICKSLEYGWLKDKEWTMRVSGADSIASSSVYDAFLIIDSMSILYGRDLSPDKIILATDKESFEISSSGIIKSKEVPKKFDVSISMELDKTPFEHVIGESDKNRHDFVVRSCYLPIKFSSKNKFKSERVHISKDLEDAQIRDSLKVFLSDIYRKTDFRDSQAEAITNLLQGLDTVVLLPTGAGKSLIYQLSGLLLPGSTIVIDPIVALMEDQVEGLNNYGIDKCVSISAANKNLISDIKLISDGEFLFILHSPERLQTSKYRSALASLGQVSLINLAVLDEAHCVSEWGHDFRPAYLNVSKNIRKICKDQIKKKPPPIAALTGTASRAVLRDVLTDLEIDVEDNGNSLIRPETFDRKELNFFIGKAEGVNVSAATFKGMIKSIPQKFGIPENAFWQTRDDDTFSGVIFCPFRKGRADQTIQKSLDIVREITNTTTTAYAGSAVPGFEDGSWEEIKRRNVKDFKNNQTQLLVSTKAYGMGIDKPNIRFTLHYGIPTSIEAFYQEAGRAGRNRKDSYCGIVFTESSEENTNSLLDPSKTIEEIKEELKGLPQDDIRNQLWFHTNNFSGIQNEVNQIKITLDKIEPLSLSAKRNKQLFEFTEDIQIPFNLLSAEDERIPQRLLKIGVLSDYQKEYGEKKYTFNINTFNLEESKNLLKKYVQSIAPGRLQEFSKELELIKFSTPKANIIALSESYIRFTYDFIERARRIAIREMCLLARKCSNNKEVKQIIQDYLHEGASVESLEILLQQSNVVLTEWFNRLELVNSQLDVNELKGQVVRLLESYPDHPGLFYLRSMTEFQTKSRDLISANNNLKYAITNSIYKYSLDISEWDFVLVNSLNLLGSKKENNNYLIAKAILELVEELVLSKEDLPAFFKILEEMEDENIDYLLAVKEISFITNRLQKGLEPIKNVFEDENTIQLLN